MARNETEATITFVCNCCGFPVEEEPVERIDREVSSCRRCGSTVRSRSIIHCLSLALFGKSIPATDFPLRKDIRGISLSDSDGYVPALEKAFSFTNTYYHAPPQLDIANPPAYLHESCDFIISSDVFEHVSPPVSKAFSGAYDLLKPGGSLVLSVPFTIEIPHIEHFPDLNEFRIVELGGRHVLVNLDRDGRMAMHTDLVFHGGPGQTLEMRVFSKSFLVERLEAAGFSEIEFLDSDLVKFGILIKRPWSVPLRCRKPLRG